MSIYSNSLNYKIQSIPKQRCFYLYNFYAADESGYIFCKIHGLVNNFYLKRHSFKRGKRHWSIISYKTKEEMGASRIFSVELDKCNGDDLVKMIERVFTKYDVDLSLVPSKSELKSYGWTE